MASCDVLIGESHKFEKGGPKMGNLIKETPYSEITATLKLLDGYGVNRNDLTHIRSDHQFAKDLANFIHCGGFEPTTSQKCAREIMGKNMFGVEEAIQHFGANPTRQQILALSEIRFSEEVLQKAKDTHVLVAVFPLSVLEIRGKVDSKLFYGQPWYNKESFAKERGEVSWQLVRKTPVENSISKDWEEQLALIGEEDEVPTAQVMVCAIIGHYLATGERLFKNIYVRTSSVDSDGNHVAVGNFDDEALDVNHWYDYHRDDDICLASVRKF